MNIQSYFVIEEDNPLSGWDEPVYWNDLTGFGSILNAEVYTQQDTKNLNLPIGGIWVSLWKAITKTVDYQLEIIQKC